jgi:excisionase family DNA binding protein
VLTNAQAARLLGVSISTMRRLQRGRRVPFFKVGRCVRYSRLDLETYLSKHRIEAVI